MDKHKVITLRRARRVGRVRKKTDEGAAWVRLDIAVEKAAKAAAVPVGAAAAEAVADLVAIAIPTASNPSSRSSVAPRWSKAGAGSASTQWSSSATSVVKL